MGRYLPALQAGPGAPPIHVVHADGYVVVAAVRLARLYSVGLETGVHVDQLACQDVLRRMGEPAVALGALATIAQELPANLQLERLAGEPLTVRLGACEAVSLTELKPLLCLLRSAARTAVKLLPIVVSCKAVRLFEESGFV